MTTWQRSSRMWRSVTKCSPSQSCLNVPESRPKYKKSPKSEMSSSATSPKGLKISPKKLKMRLIGSHLMPEWFVFMIVGIGGTDFFLQACAENNFLRKAREVWIMRTCFFHNPLQTHNNGRAWVPSLLFNGNTKFCRMKFLTCLRVAMPQQSLQVVCQNGLPSLKSLILLILT